MIRQFLAFVFLIAAPLAGQNFIQMSDPIERNQAISVRRERRWTTAGDKPARELDRSTR